MASHNEDEYFAKEDLEKLRKLHHEMMKKLGAKGVAEAKATYANRCPNCGLEMRKLPSFKGVTLLRCFNCGGAFIPPEASAELRKQSKAKDHATVEAIIDWIHPAPSK